MTRKNPARGKKSKPLRSSERAAIDKLADKYFKIAKDRSFSHRHATPEFVAAQIRENGHVAREHALADYGDEGFSYAVTAWESVTKPYELALSFYEEAVQESPLHEPLSPFESVQDALGTYRLILLAWIDEEGEGGQHSVRDVRDALAWFDVLAAAGLRQSNPPPHRHSIAGEDVLGVYPPDGGDEVFYDDSCRGMKTAVEKSIIYGGRPSFIRNYHGDSDGGWTSGSLFAVQTKPLDTTKYKYPAGSYYPNPKGSPAMSKTKDKDYYKMHLILPHDDEIGDGRALAVQVLDWHGGQGTMVYSLGSTGMNNYVSAAMIDAAVEELESALARNKKLPKANRWNRKEIKELKDLIGHLDAVARFPDEFSAREMGVEDEDTVYEYSTWLMDDEDEFEENPRRSYMTKRQFEDMFRAEVIPAIAERYEQDGVPDKPARREAWNNTVDHYIKDGQLPESAGDWSHPRWLETTKRSGSNSIRKIKNRLLR